MNTHYADLPLDTPDDDPRWRGWSEALNQGFLAKTVLSDEALKVERDGARENGYRQRCIMSDAPGVPEHTPVATLVSTDQPVNVGHGRMLDSNYITVVTTRRSHRRRGLLRELMTRDLTEAAERGVSLASLGVSEGSIYGRFGFGIAGGMHKVETETRMWQLRHELSGHCETVSINTLDPHIDRLLQAQLDASRGAHAPLSHHRQMLRGLSPHTGDPSKELRGVLHWDADGTVDGMARWQSSGWGGDDATVTVTLLTAADPAVELALIDHLAGIDLVSKITWTTPDPHQAVAMSLANPDAAKFVSAGDFIWLRVLDPIKALAERGWDTDGDLVLKVTDPMGFADGTFRIAARDGRAEVTRTDDTPQVSVDVEGLGSAYFGHVGFPALGTAGRADGDLAAAQRLFAVVEPPRNNVMF